MWPDMWGRVLVIKHRGRTSGNTYHTPVNYAIVDGEVYCTAGFGQIADWYKNLMTDPEMEIWMPDGWWAGTAHDITNHPDRLVLMREVIKGSGIVASLFGFNIRSMSDEALDHATQKYRLVHLKREEARTGKGGPGELKWVWPLATMLLLMWPRRKKR